MKSISLNVAQYNKLKKYSSIIKRAKEFHYYSALSRTDFDELLSIYESLFTDKVCKTCGESILNMLSKLGELYIIYEEKHKKDE